MFSKAFWVDAAERAVKTFCQTLVALFGAGVTILSISWGDAVVVALTAAVVSILTSVGSTGFGRTGTPALIDLRDAPGTSSTATTASTATTPPTTGPRT